MTDKYSPVKGRLIINNVPGMKGKKKNLTIALSVQDSEFPDRFYWAQEHDFALEYTPDPLHPEHIAGHVKPFIKEGIPVRFHCRFAVHELGNSDPVEAEHALKTHIDVIDAMSGLGEPVVGVHLNLSQKVPFDEAAGERNLVRLVEYANKKQITVNLENLRRGPGSNPHNIAKWAAASGAMITLDIGHAVESEMVKSGELKTVDIIDLFSGRLNEVHMYGKETDRHYPIENMEQHGLFVDRLLPTRCEWWTIELDYFQEALNTRRLLLEHICKTTKIERKE